MRTKELSIALRSPVSKTTTKAELQKLKAVYDAGKATPWIALPTGVALQTVKAKAANVYYVLLLWEDDVIGYLLLTKNKVTVGTTVLKGWTVLHSYLERDIRGLGFMRRVYDLILTKGRLISAPAHTPKGMAMWVSRIKTDNRHLYFVVTGKGTMIPVSASSIDNLKRTVWDGDPMTVLVCGLKTDTKMKKLMLTRQSANSKSEPTD